MPSEDDFEAVKGVYEETRSLMSSSDGSSHPSDEDDLISEAFGGDSDSGSDDSDDSDEEGEDGMPSLDGTNIGDMDDEHSDEDSDSQSSGLDDPGDGWVSPDDDSDGFNDPPTAGGSGSGPRNRWGAGLAAGRRGGPATAHPNNANVVLIPSDESSDSDSDLDSDLESPNQNNNGGVNEGSGPGGGEHMNVLDDTQQTSIPPASTHIIDLTLDDDDNPGVNHQRHGDKTASQPREIEPVAQDTDIGSVSESMFFPLPSEFESTASPAPSNNRDRLKRGPNIINLAGDDAPIRHSPLTRNAMGNHRARSDTDAEVKTESGTDITRNGGGSRRPIVDLTNYGGSDTAVKEESPAVSDELRRQQQQRQDHGYKRSRSETGAEGDGLAGQPPKRPRPNLKPPRTSPTGLMGALRYFQSQPSRQDREDSDSV